MTRWAYILEKIECVPRNTRWRNDYKWENPLRRKRQEIISPWSFRLGPRMDTSAEQTAPGLPALLFFTTHKLSNEDWGKSWNHFWMCLGTTGHCRLQQQRQKTFLTLPMHCPKWPYNCPPGQGVVQSLSCVRLFETPWTAALQAPLSFTISQFPQNHVHCVRSVMLPNHLILCCPFLLLPSIFPSIRIFSNELALHIRWPKYWSFSISASVNIQGWYPVGLTGLILQSRKG